MSTSTLATVNDLAQALQGVSLNTNTNTGTDNDDVTDFFLAYEFAGFHHDPQQSPEAEFNRLCRARRWGAPRIAAVRTVFQRVIGTEARNRNAIDAVDTNSPLWRFFNEHAVNPYVYRGRSPPIEWLKLLKAKGWTFKDCKRQGSEQEDLYQRYLRVVEHEVEYLIQQNPEVSDGTLRPWEYLCQLFGVGAAPLSKTKARKLLWPIHINIFDYIDHERRRRAGQPSVLQTFPTVRDLAQYSIYTGRIYNLKAAKDDGTLKLLLRGLRQHWS